MSDTDTAKQHINIAGGRGRPVGTTRKTPDELVHNPKDCIKQMVLQESRIQMRTEKVILFREL